MSGGSLGSLFIDLLINDQKYASGLRRASQETSRATGQWQGDFNKSGQAIGAVVSPVNNLSAALRGLAASFAGALTTQKVIQYADSWKMLEARLGLVTTSSAQLRDVQDSLFQIAQGTNTPLNDNISGYIGLAQSLSEAQRGSYDLIRISELLSKTLKISGADAVASTTFFTQFRQAASSDFKAIGQELQTFADQNPRFYAILRDEAQKTGKTLKQMGSDGELSFDMIAKALVKAGDVIDQEAAAIPTTVGQALTQLDNAFLQYIGRSDAAAASTSSLATALSGLAANFNAVANVVVTVAAVAVARSLGSMTSALVLNSIAFRNSAREAYAYQMALARMAGVTTVAVRGVVAMSAATRVLSAGLALVGGPIGLAFLAVMGGITVYQSKLNAEAQKYNGIAAELSRLQTEIALTTGETQKRAIEKSAAVKAGLMEEYKAAVLLSFEYQRLAEKTSLFSVSGILARTMGAASNGINNSRIEEMKKQIDMMTEMENIPSVSSGGAVAVNAKTESEQEKRQKRLQQIYKQNEEYITGVDRATIKYSETMGELNELLKAGEISQLQYQNAVQRLDAEFEASSEKANQWGIDVSEIGKDAARNTQQAFADFLFDPFEGGLKGMVSSFTDSVRRMIAEAQAAQLVSSLFGSSAGGTGIGLLGSLFGSQGSLSRAVSGVEVGPLQSFGGLFADGGHLEPGQWGIAGEAGAELIYGGKTGMTIIPQSGGGGNVYQIDARGADAGAVARIERALLTLAGPGQVERRVSVAQQRGAI